MKLQIYKSPLGGEILNLDLNKKIDKKKAAKIKNFVNERLVVLIRNQEIDDYKLKEFSALFGDLDPPAPNPYGVNFLPEHPEINVISNVKNTEGIPIGNLGDGDIIMVAYDCNTVTNGEVWFGKNGTWGTKVPGTHTGYAYGATVAAGLKIVLLGGSGSPTGNSGVIQKDTSLSYTIPTGFQSI